MAIMEPVIVEIIASSANPSVLIRFCGIREKMIKMEPSEIMR